MQCVVDVAADWLDGDDVFGRDGTWAARTLRHVTAELPLDDATRSHRTS